MLLVGNYPEINRKGGNIIDIAIYLTERRGGKKSHNTYEENLTDTEIYEKIFEVKEESNEGNCANKSDQKRNYLDYIDPMTHKRKQKVVSTGLEAKGNKRRAEKMIQDYVEKYQYLEAPRTDTKISNHISLCDFLDYWLAGKKLELRQSTYEGYACRIHFIKAYFKKDNPELIALTPKDFNDFFRYALEYGKVNQKTHKREPLAVRTVRSCHSILHAVYSEAVVDGIMKTNPLDNITVHGKKNRDYNEELIFLTEEEISEVLHFMDRHYPRLVGITFMGGHIMDSGVPGYQG